MKCVIIIAVLTVLACADFQRTNERGCISPGLDDTQIAMCNNTDLGLSVECSSRQSWPATTILEIKCRDSWKPTAESVIKIVTVCANGGWINTNQNLKCKLDCGWVDTPYDDDNPLPWNVGIFTEDDVGSGNFSYTCSGTLISSKAILTAAQCLQYTIRRQTVFLGPENVRIFLGINSNRANVGGAKHYPAGKIILHPEYNPIDFESDLAIILLKNPVKVSRKLHPICFPNTNDEPQITSGRIETFSDRGSARVMHLGYMGSHKCHNSSSALEKLVRNNTFCAEFKKGYTGFDGCTNYAGAGFVTITSSLTRLDGIRTGAFSECNEPLVFTKLSKFQNWIMREINGIKTVAATTNTPATTSRPPTRRVPTSNVEFVYPEGVQTTPNPYSYEIRRPEETGTFKTSRPRSSTTPPPHHVGGHDEDDAIVATWTSKQHNVPQYPQEQQETPKYQTASRQPTTNSQQHHPALSVDEDLSYRSRRCPDLMATEGSNLQCRHQRGIEPDNCEKGGWYGTIASYQCQRHYTPVFGFDTVVQNCSDQGDWRPRIEFGCKLNCGVSSQPKTAFIVNGAVSKPLSWPWHATIFTKNSHNDGWAYKCGGALISKNVVLTAAHCVTHLSTTTLIDKEELTVILAASSSDFDLNFADHRAKLFRAERTAIPDTYNAVTFHSDIALIQLHRDVELSDYIKPVCWPSQRNADHRNLERIHLEHSSTIKGVAVGFGIDEKGQIGSELKETALPYVTAQACRKALDRTPTDSQFCAGYLNGTSVCNGDSGGGLYFTDNTQSHTRFIIQGIVSNGDSYKGPHTTNRVFCNHNNYAVFTRVISFSNWIHSFLDSIQDKRRSSVIIADT